MEPTKNALKINNSYESEPSSSGCGSTLSENNDYISLEIEDMHLPFLLQPQPIIEEVIAITGIKTPPQSTPLTFNDPIPPVISSQASPLAGFTDSPYGKLKLQFFGSPALREAIHLENGPKVSLFQDLPAPQKVCSKYYNTIVEENSCNAVDMELTDSSLQRQQSQVISQTTSDGNAPSDISFNGVIKSLTESLNVTNKIDDIPSSNIFKEIPTVPQLPCHHSSPTGSKGNPPSVLSFNRKIKSLKEDLNVTDKIDDISSSNIFNVIPNNPPTMFLQTALNNSTKLTSSFLIRKYNNEKSPDLFEDADEEDNINYTGVIMDEEEAEITTHENSNVHRSLSIPIYTNAVKEQTLNCISQISKDSQVLFRANCRRDRELLRRARNCLSGIPPPPSFTVLQLDLFEAVTRKKDKILNFFNNDKLKANVAKTTYEQTTTSILKPTHTLEVAMTLDWKELLGVRQHGLSYNLSKASEHKEFLALSVIDRFIGAETATSYRSSPSSAKKRNFRMKMLTQSPGNRLSHLAKRRSIFSSASLATTGVHTNLGPQILIDKKKSKHKRKGVTPKRKTPGSFKKTCKTPSSSARKRLFRNDMVRKPGLSRETSKRALFQSPAKKFEKKAVIISKPLIKPEIAHRVEKSKRALFSPENDRISQSSSSSYMLYTQPSLENLLKRKRDTADEDDTDSTFGSQRCKLFRSSTENLTPRALKIKSQSFCVGAGFSTDSAVSISSNRVLAAGKLTSSSSLLCDYGKSGYASGKMQRSFSEMAAPSTSVSKHQRGKILWAVSQALQEKKITSKHENFKEYASVLSRVVRRIYLEYYQKNTSTSETMLRLARKYVFYVITGQSVDEIYFKAKALINEKIEKQNNTRLTGYIGPEEYQQRKLLKELSSQSISLSDLHTQSQTISQASSNRIPSMITLFGSEMDSYIIQTSDLSSSVSTCIPILPTNSISKLPQDINSKINNTVNESMLKNRSTEKSTRLSIQINSKLENSSSKNNLSGLALRENVDGELRRSAQKNFTGKDQRNCSPYGNSTANISGSGSMKKVYTHYVGEKNFLGAKAKRVISFDC